MCVRAGTVSYERKSPYLARKAMVFSEEINVDLQDLLSDISNIMPHFTGLFSLEERCPSAGSPFLFGCPSNLVPPRRDSTSSPVSEFICEWDGGGLARSRSVSPVPSSAAGSAGARGRDSTDERGPVVPISKRITIMGQTTYENNEAFAEEFFNDSECTNAYAVGSCVWNDLFFGSLHMEKVFTDVSSDFLNGPDGGRGEEGGSVRCRREVTRHTVVKKKNGVFTEVVVTIRSELIAGGLELHQVMKIRCIGGGGSGGGKLAVAVGNTYPYNLQQAEMVSAMAGGMKDGPSTLTGCGSTQPTPTSSSLHVDFDVAAMTRDKMERSEFEGAGAEADDNGVSSRRVMRDSAKNWGTTMAELVNDFKPSQLMVGNQAQDTRPQINCSGSLDQRPENQNPDEQIPNIYQRIERVSGVQHPSSMERKSPLKKVRGLRDSVVTLQGERGVGREMRASAINWHEAMSEVRDEVRREDLESDQGEDNEPGSEDEEKTLNLTMPPRRGSSSAGGQAKHNKFTNGWDSTMAEMASNVQKEADGFDNLESSSVSSVGSENGNSALSNFLKVIEGEEQRMSEKGGGRVKSGKLDR